MLSSQNYDFIELMRYGDYPVDLSNFRLEYRNSLGNLSFVKEFPHQLLTSQKLLLVSAESPQYITIEDAYKYDNGKSGIASTAGTISLFYEDILIDEVCWGDEGCPVERFYTKITDNYSYVRNADFSYKKESYYPDGKEQNMLERIKKDDYICRGLEFSEIYSNYKEDPKEQFVEMYNSLDEELSLNHCYIKYKDSNYHLSGSALPGEYFLLQLEDFTLVRDPATMSRIELFDDNDDLMDFIEYPHGQKSNTSFARFADAWRMTYVITPGAENQYAEFQSCPAGKEINPETGNCINIKTEPSVKTCPAGKYLNPETNRCKTIEKETVKTCKAGYYLNPETNRCNKIKSDEKAELKPCAEGYERNPETNRCRKIQKNEGTDYPVAEIKGDSGESSNSGQKFNAVVAVVATMVIGGGYVIYQYRKEIKDTIIKACRLKKS